MLLTLLIGGLLAVSTSATPLTTLPSQDIEQRDDPTTRNDLLDLDCRPVTVVFARGTIEPGNVGLLAGPPFFIALGSLIGDDNLAVQGVDYPATIEGYLMGGDPNGADQLAYLAQYAFQKCPDTKLILSGYSQGAQVVHLGAAELPDDVASAVTGVVLFGDPDDAQPLNDIPTARIDTICIVGDLICDGLPIVDPSHLSYAFTAPQAAEFVAGLL